MLLRRSGLKRQRLCRWPRLAPRLDPRLPARMTAWGGLLFDELSPGMAGSSAEQDARAEQWRNNKQPSFSPLLFIISAFGGNDEQCSEAGIQLWTCRHAKRDTTAAKPRYSFTPLECLLPTLFSQSTERAGTHADAWKQDAPVRKGGAGGHPYSLILRVSSLIRALRARCAREKSLPAIFSVMLCCGAPLTRSRGAYIKYVSGNAP